MLPFKIRCLYPFKTMPKKKAQLTSFCNRFRIPGIVCIFRNKSFNFSSQIMQSDGRAGGMAVNQAQYSAQYSGNVGQYPAQYSGNPAQYPGIPGPAQYPG